MIKTVIKRNGDRQPFDANKLNRWGEWAAETLGRYVDWGTIVLNAVSNLPESCKSSDLQNQLITECLNMNTWSYNRMAGRLYVAQMRKEIFGDEIPTVYDVHRRLKNAGIMIKLDYTEEEYEKIEKIINHNLDFKASHSELHAIRRKYSLQNRVTGKEYETQQFVYMRMAMALAEEQSKERRFDDLKKWYKYFSEKKINAPTPNFVNLGTPLRGYASCLLYKSGDNAQSLAIGDHIAYTMTCMSAGIGAMIETRSMDEPVKGGVISHQGKLPYYKALNGAVHANMQNGRGGAATVYHTVYDPEIETLLQLKNPMTTEDKRIRGLDYALQFNKFFMKKAARGEDYFTFSVKSAPDLYKALFSGDAKLFEELYSKYENDNKFKKQYLNAREILLTVLNEAYETGRAYLFNIDEANYHTPFKDTIYTSNLCFTGDTMVAVADGRNAVRIDQLAQESNKEIKFPVYSARFDKKFLKWIPEIKQAVAFKTGDKKVIRVTLTDGSSFKCTEDHPLAISGLCEYVEAKDSVGFPIESINIGVMVKKIKYLDEVVPVYDLTVEDNHNFYISFKNNNGILVHNCTEIFEPTKEYYHMMDLYSEEDHGRGEVATCSLGAINVSAVDDDEYEDVMYYTLLMIDKCIDMNYYPLRHVGVTAKARRSAGIGIMNLAHALAKNKLSYSTKEGKEFIHYIAERHAYYGIRASLKLGKELGNAKWMHKTKWPEGWLPIDTYNKNVDSIIKPELKFDWEQLRKDIIENGGIRNSVVCASMPGESSSVATGATNSLYPIRELNLIKTNNTNVVRWDAPDSEKLAKYYELATDVPTEDLIDMYAIVQKFTDQGISADLYRKIIDDETVSTSEMLKIMFYMVKMGMKSRYYVNIKATEGINSDDNSGAWSDENDENCESCTI